METQTVNQNQTKKPKKKVSQVFKPIAPENARRLVKVILESNVLNDRRLALAGLIAGIGDARKDSPKYQTAELLLKSLFVETEQFKAQLSHFINKATAGDTKNDK